MVDDQDKALKFYTEVFGFVKKHDIPVGEYRWLTVVSPEDPTTWSSRSSRTRTRRAKAFQDAMFAQGIPLAAFEAGGIAAEFTRLKGLGVVFTQRADAGRSGHDRDLFATRAAT